MATKKDLSRATGRALAYLEDLPETVPYQVIEVKVKFDQLQALAIVKTVSGQGPEIGFVGGATLTGVVRKLAAQIRDGKLKLRPDKYLLEKVDESAEGW